MTESSGFPFRRDHPLASIADDPFALYERCDCPCGGHYIETRIEHDAWCPGPKRTIEDTSNEHERTTQQ
jgi:hypothetical protein